MRFIHPAAVGLVKNLYSYAVPRELCRKDFGKYVVMPRTREEVHHEPFPDEELKLLWQTLARLGLREKSPHSCRHTFSRLCKSDGVREADRKRMLGHSFGNDITNGIYGHRTLEELRAEIEKIQVPEE